ncbi:MAG: hypothetical protein WD043_02585 [Gemmatimonadales bacterium]
MTGRSWIAALVTIACSGERPNEGAEFGFEADTATAVSEFNILRSDRQPAGGNGIFRMDADVLLPVGIGEATARATLRHVIDSIAAADTMIGSIRLTGFMIGRPRPGTEELDVNPMMSAIWMPTDTIGVTGRRRTARYRTHFVLLQELPQVDGTIP